MGETLLDIRKSTTSSSVSDVEQIKEHEEVSNISIPKGFEEILELKYLKVWL